MAAYQALGQFIATFADRERSGFEINCDGQLMSYKDFKGFESDKSPPSEDPSLESDRQTR